MERTLQPEEAAEMFVLLDELEETIRARIPRGEAVDLVLQLRNELTRALADAGRKPGTVN